MNGRTAPEGGAGVCKNGMWFSQKEETLGIEEASHGRAGCWTEG